MSCQSILSYNSRAHQLTSSPNILTEEDLLAQQSELRKRKLVYYSFLVGTPTVAFLVLGARSFVVIPAVLGHYIGKCFSLSSRLNNSSPSLNDFQNTEENLHKLIMSANGIETGSLLNAGILTTPKNFAKHYQHLERNKYV
mmetsp:Transcript_13777/g.14330  ORF Transcript_13777/g.14330 Transcript_13777/m.14330 type:complete len:141 (-) Transcript_13777:123-545(-)